MRINITPYLLLLWLFCFVIAQKQNGSEQYQFNLLLLNSYFPIGVALSVLQMAERRIDKDQLLPDNSFITVHHQNVECDSSIGLAAVIMMEHDVKLRSKKRDLHAVIGPGCSDSMVTMAHVATSMNIPVFGYMSTAAELNNRDQFRTFIRTSATGTTFAAAIVMTVLHYGWEKVAILTDMNHELSMMVTAALQAGYPDSSGANRELTVTQNVLIHKDSSLDEIDRSTSEFKKNSRIILLNTGELCDPLTLKVLKSMSRNGMNNNEYVFITYQIELSNSSEALVAGCVKKNEGNDLLDKMWSKVLEIHHDFGPIDELMNIYAAQDIQLTGGFIQLPAFAVAMHDAVYLWAVAVNRSLSRANANMKKTTSGVNIFKESTNVQVKGLLEYFWMDNKAELTSSYIVKIIKDDGNYLNVLNLKANKSTTGHIGSVFLKTDLETNFWEFGLPKDTPPCGYEGCPTLTTETLQIVGLVAGGLLLFVTVCAAIYVYRLREAKYRDTPWKLEPAALITLNDEQMKNLVGSILSVNQSRSHASGSKSGVSSRSSTTISEAGLDKQTEAAEAAVNWRVCSYRGEHINVRRLRKFKKLAVDEKKVMIHLYEMLNLRNDNIALFMGLCDDPALNSFDVAFQYCTRGSLKTVLANKDLDLDAVFRASFARDVMQGLTAIHASPVKMHGQLNIFNCMVSSNWTVKLSSFGLNPLCNMLHDKKSDTARVDLPTDLSAYELLYLAPELLIQQNAIDDPIQSSVLGDVYAMSMLLYELITEISPFGLAIRNFTAEELIDRVKSKELSSTAHLKKAAILAKDHNVSEMIGTTILDASAAAAEDRPSMKLLTRQLNKYLPRSSESIVGHMMQVMEKYAKNLEKVVQERTGQLELSQQRADQLLYQMLPRVVADKLKTGQAVPPVTYMSTTVCFCDIVGFTYLCSMSNPMQIVDLLNNCFQQFDAVITQYGVFKVETIGDAYMMASGLFETKVVNHAEVIANTILAMSELTGKVLVSHIPEMTMMIRAGFHSGSVAAGVIGLQAPRYCLFGDTVNTASRMESTGEPGRVQISEASRKFIANNKKFEITFRGKTAVKGKGEMETYWLARSVPVTASQKK